MSACEWCWARAVGRARNLPDISVVDEYERILEEQERLGKDAQCPYAATGRSGVAK